MSDHPSKMLERQIAVFPEHLVGEAFLMLGHSWLWGIQVFQYKGSSNGDRRIGFGFASKNNVGKSRDSGNQIRPKKDISNNTQYLPSEVSTSKYVLIFSSKTEYVEQLSISCMWLLFAITVQAAVTLVFIMFL